MKVIPEQMKQASYIGIFFSILFIVLISFMVIN